MRYLIVSDVHANLEALHAVLTHADRAGWDHLAVLGDLIGYGADPTAVVETIQALQPRAIVRGNHDKVGTGLEPAVGFNPTARIAITWTQQALTAEASHWVRALPMGPVPVDEAFAICHGAPFNEDEYLEDNRDLRRAAAHVTAPLCFFGHTHVPVAWHAGAGQVPLRWPGSGADVQTIDVREAGWLVNPGSVGQPRDGDPRAAYVVYDASTATVTFARVPYDVVGAQEKIRRAGLPERLAQRLALGH
jgi:predicted phosphodiesterase